MNCTTNSKAFYSQQSSGGQNPLVCCIKIQKKHAIMFAKAYKILCNINRFKTTIETMDPHWQYIVSSFSSLPTINAKVTYQTCHSVIENVKLPMSVSVTARGGHLRRWMEELTWAMVCPVQGTVQRSVWNLTILPCKFSFIWNINREFSLIRQWKYQTRFAPRSKTHSWAVKYQWYINNEIMKNVLPDKLLIPLMFGF